MLRIDLPSTFPGITQGAVVLAREFPKDRYGARRERHRPRTRLRLRQVQLAGFEVDVLPMQVQDLALAAAGQEQQSQRRHRVDRQPPHRSGLVERPAQTLELVRCQERSRLRSRNFTTCRHGLLASAIGPLKGARRYLVIKHAPPPHSGRTLRASSLPRQRRLNAKEFLYLARNVEAARDRLRCGQAPAAGAH